MIFNSIEFVVFLPVVFILYWFVFNEKLKSQNVFLLIVSYIFYGWWDWRFLFLIGFSTVVDYAIGLILSKSIDEDKRKFIFSISLIINLGLLGFFKYYNFFIESFVDAFTFLGKKIEPNRLNIILPVGISFYTFQTLSYTIDIYRNKLEPAKSLINFAVFVSFFPQLVAGPIERATNLLPQFYRSRKVDYNSLRDGLRQILWGLFKKIVVADNCAESANEIFNNYEDYSGSTLVSGAVLFAFQIYGDFSGYSDIAIGTSKLFGFDLMNNFKTPYFSRDVGEFWRRWHISLNTWFRDYLYIPLGGSKGSTIIKVRNVLIIFIISSFWHGANWTYIIWGLLNAIYFIPLMLLKKNNLKYNEYKYNLIPPFKEVIQVSLTFTLTTFAWVFFRSESVSSSLIFIDKIFTKDLFSFPLVFSFNTIVFIMIQIIMEWVQRDKDHVLHFKESFPVYKRWVIYFVLTFLIIWFGGSQEEFIYFQF